MRQCVWCLMSVCPADYQGIRHFPCFRQILGVKGYFGDVRGAVWGPDLERFGSEEWKLRGPKNEQNSDFLGKC